MPYKISDEKIKKHKELADELKKVHDKAQEAIADLNSVLMQCEQFAEEIIVDLQSFQDDQENEIDEWCETDESAKFYDLRQSWENAIPFEEIDELSEDLVTDFAELPSEAEESEEDDEEE